VNTVTRLCRSIYDTCIGEPVRRRGVLWTLLAWTCLLSSISFFMEVWQRGLALNFVAWLVAFVLFLKVHRPDRQRREKRSRRFVER